MLSVILAVAGVEVVSVTEVELEGEKVREGSWALRGCALMGCGRTHLRCSLIFFKI